jgi:DNA-binding MarR family transcriptional regulator
VPGTDPGPVSVCYLLRRTRQRLLVVAAGLLPDDRHPRDLALLYVISERGPVTQQWLADYLAINRSVMVKLIDALESNGDVVRDRRPGDRRSYALRTTPSGRRAMKKLSIAVRKADRALTASLSEGERTRLVTLLASLVVPYFRPAPPAELSDLAGFLVAHACFRLEALGDSRLAPTRLTVRTFVALATLAGHAPCSQHDLAGFLEIRPAATVELIDELEQLGTVRRTRNPADRRSYALELTTAGEQLLLRAQGLLAEAADEFMGRLDGTQRAELVELLATVAGVARPAGPPAVAAAIED